MAAALRSAARKICGHAFERPHALLRTAASAAIKEEQWRLLARIGHGRSSLRRFTSSESPSFLNNKNKIFFSKRNEWSYETQCFFKSSGYEMVIKRAVIEVALV
ncbi:uncharacterized protein [Triticum aestivum]|uniref:Uncharacterized protein n=1 Tax=Triticum turgidum subsp. durum TaxID=4567 RepID=A0A9R1QCK8_TRITD|nr:uncharacterized protein LOC123065061 isoform X2 [Triticum aestivum]XP_044344368.1 uncharacterized protein LOC123065064 isoform X2 [Triticum aestivum]VAH74050.1 unnamed protein product [Triticum turgidum subsp. durum]